MNKAKKYIIIFISVILAILFIFAGCYIISYFKYTKNVQNIHIENIDISKIQDGIYYGKCDVGFISAEVNVTVENGKITDIHLISHKNERGKAAESITNEIIKKQIIDADSVSGATNSSKTIKKAIENALLNSNNE